MALTTNQVFDIVKKAPRSIGYTEIWERINEEATYLLQEEGYDVYFQHLELPSFHPQDNGKIIRDITYVTWDEFAYFNRIKREGLEEA